MSADSRRSPKDTQNETGKTDESVRQAVERAAHHARLALLESVASSRALLDAASIAVSGESAQTHPRLSEFAQALDQVSDALSGDSSSLGSAALVTLQKAIDSEISRWETRSQTDTDARAVLRAFLALREFLWELGVRPKTAERDRAVDKRERQRAADRDVSCAEEPNFPSEVRRGTPRVQRIKIEG